MLLTSLVLATVLSPAPSQETAAEAASPQTFAWPQWDGPARDGISRETGWSSEGAEENIWEVQVGLGYSTMVVAEGRVVTMGYDVDAGLDLVWCLDAATGEELWAHAYEAEIWNRAHEGGTVNTPTIDGDTVYTLNREANLYALDFATGEVRWHVALNSEEVGLGLELPTWGFSASPVVLGDKLFLNCGRFLCVDKASGEIAWASEKDYGHAYGTPSPFALDDTAALVALNGEGVAVVAQETGEELYFHAFSGQNRGVNAATPIVVDDAVFVSSGTIPAGALLAFGDAGQMIPVWQNREMANSFSGCVLLDGHLYGFDQRTLKCMDLMGATKWEERGIGNGALIASDGRLLVQGADGALHVVEATPEEYRELSNTQLFEAGRYWTKPTLANGIVYCRSSKGLLVARDHRGE